MTTSTAPTRTMNPRRVAAIGAVAALAIGAGVVAGSFLLSGRASLGSGAAYVPADTPFYVEMRVQPSADQDAALREFLGHFPAIDGIDLDRPLADQVAERIDQTLADSGAGVTWADEVAPWFDGHVAVAITEVSFELPAEGEMPAAPPVVVLLGVSDQAAATSAIDRILAEAGGPAFTETTHEGVTIYVASDVEVMGQSGAYALTSDQLIFGSDEAAVTAALDARSGSRASLATNSEITRLTESLPDDWLAFASFDLTTIIADALEEAEAADPTTTETLRSMLEHQPLRGAMAVSAAGDRILLDSSSDAPTGPYAAANAERGLAAEVPSDALYFSEAGNLGAALGGVLSTLKEAAAVQPEAAEQIETAESALGADLEELVTWIGDGAVAIGIDDGEPYGGVVLVPNDMAAAERRIDQIVTFAGLASVDPTSGVSVSTEDVGGVTVTSIQFGAPDLGEELIPTVPDVSVQLAMTDDRVLVGIGETFVGRALALADGDGLDTNERYTGAIAEMGSGPNAGVVWIDIAGVRTAVTELMGASGEADEALAWIEPLDRFVAVSRLDGDVLTQRAALLVD